MIQIIGLFLRAIYTLLARWFGALFSRLWIFILTLAPELIKKIMTYLGVGFVSYVGADYVIQKLTTVLANSLNSVPADILAILQLCKFDKGIAILIAGMTIAATIKATTKSVHLVKSS